MVIVDDRCCPKTTPDFDQSRCRVTSSRKILISHEGCVRKQSVVCSTMSYRWCLFSICEIIRNPNCRCCPLPSSRRCTPSTASRCFVSRRARMPLRACSEGRGQHRQFGFRMISHILNRHHLHDIVEQTTLCLLTYTLARDQYLRLEVTRQRD